MPSARPAPPRRCGRAQAISLLRFDNLSGDPRNGWVGPALAETLGTEIGLGGRLRVIPGEAGQGRPGRSSGPRRGRLRPASLASLRRRLGADYVLSGSYLISGEGPAAAVRLDIALQDTRGGAVVSLSRSGAVAELPALVTLVGADLRKDLGVKPERADEVKLAVNLQAPTAEVMSHIGYGLDALHRYDAARARDEFLEAVAQAPAYAPAYADLAQAWSALGYQAKARAAAEQAAAYAADLPDPDAAGDRRPAPVVPVRLGRRGPDASPPDRLAPRRPGIPAAADRRPDRGRQARRRLRRPRGSARPARRGRDDPRLELAAARIAAARDDDKGRADHAARALAQARANGETGLAADAEVQLAIALTGRDPKAAGETLRRPGGLSAPGQSARRSVGAAEPGQSPVRQRSGGGAGGL